MLRDGRARCAGFGLAQAALLGLELPVVCLELVADAYANGDGVKLDVADLCAVEEHVGLNPDLLNVNVDRPFLVDWDVKTGLERRANAVCVERHAFAKGGHVHIHRVRQVRADTDVGLNSGTRHWAILESQHWWQVFERANRGTADAHGLLLRHRQDEFSRQVRREEVREVNFGNSLVVDGDRVSGCDAWNCVGLVGEVQIDAANADHQIGQILRCSRQGGNAKDGGYGEAKGFHIVSFFEVRQLQRG